MARKERVHLKGIITASFAQRGLGSPFVLDRASRIGLPVLPGDF